MLKCEILKYINKLNIWLVKQIKLINLINK
jgi:hypothetical protein